MEPAIGIDLGTTNAVVAHTDQSGTTTTIAGPQGNRLVPSCVHFPAGGEPVVGEDALQYAVVGSDRVARLFKRGMGKQVFLDSGEPFTADGRTWTPVDLSALVLKSLAGNAEHHLGGSVPRAVITVPASFGEAERAATEAASELAGLEVLRIIDEQTATALSNGLEQVIHGRTLVFDMGGGTLDVTILDVDKGSSIEVLATGGDRRLGGIEFDRRILNRMIDQIAQETGADLNHDPVILQDALERAVEIKHELSRAPRSRRRVIADGRLVTFELSRAGLEELLADERQKVEDAIIDTMERAGVTAGDLAEVLMVGGSSRMPMFQKLLEGLTGRTPRLSRNLDEDVARGAAIYGATLGSELGFRQPREPSPPLAVVSQGVGVTAWRDENGQPVPDYNEILIRAGTPLPAQGEITLDVLYATTALAVNLNEGDDTELRHVRELGSAVGEFEGMVEEGHPVRFTVEYVTEQIIQAKAYDGVSGRFLCELNVQRERQVEESMPGGSDLGR